MNYFSAIKWAAVALAFVGTIYLFNRFIDHHQSIGYDRAAAEYASAMHEAKQKALATEREMQTKYTEAQNARIETEKQLSIHRRNASVASERMRVEADNFSIRLSEATAETARHAASTAAELLGQCSEEYSKVAASSDGHFADWEQCQLAWPVE